MVIFSNWSTFWEQFVTSVDSRKHLINAKKLVYLQHAVKNGSAISVIQGLSQSGENLCMEYEYHYEISASQALPWQLDVIVVWFWVPCIYRLLHANITTTSKEALGIEMLGIPTSISLFNGWCTRIIISAHTLIVRWLNVTFWDYRSLADKSIKFCMMLPWGLLTNFSLGALMKCFCKTSYVQKYTV